MFIYWLMFPGTLLVFEKIRTLYTMYQNRSVVELASTHDNVSFVHESPAMYISEAKLLQYLIAYIF